MHSLTEKYLRHLSFSADEAAAMRTLGEYQGKQALFYKQSPETLESLKQVAVIESSESSNRLEGITAPKERIEALVLKNSTPKDRSEQEIAGYRDALSMIHEAAERKEFPASEVIPFSTNVVLQIHSTICRFMPNPGGKWKPTDNEITETHPDGTKRVRFVPTTAVQTPHAMEDLVKNYQQAIKPPLNQDPLIVIPLAVLDFLCIHPFSDGNGRATRLLTLMLLYHFDYRVGRYISLERVFEETKESYYETLEKSSQGWHQGQHDVHPWLNYFWGALTRAYREFEERVGNVKAGRGSKTDQIRQAVQRKIGPFAISDIEDACPGVSRDMVRNVLRQMKEENLIESTGKGRSAKWVKK